jgi:para-nitrobenzyl esterase
MISIPTLRILEAKAEAGGRPGYLFEVAFPHPYAGGAYGAAHGVDASMIFENLHTRGLSGDRRAGAIARCLANTWTEFARTGVPWSPGIPRWPPYGPESRATMIIDAEWSVRDEMNALEHAAWREVDLSNAGLVSRTRLAM